MRAVGRGARRAGALVAVLVVVPAGQAVAAPAPAPSVAFRVSDPRVAAAGTLVAGVAHSDVWWTLGTRSGRARLFALGRDGRVRAEYSVAGVPAGRRWDALTIVRNGYGAGSLFLGDLSEGRRGGLALYRVAEPGALRDGTVAARAYKVRYPDGGHGAAALLGDPREGRLYVVTRAASAASVFALPGVLGPGVNELTRVRTLGFGVRSGAFAPDGRVVFRTSDGLRVLGGIRDEVSHVVGLDVAGGGVGVSADGRSAVLSDEDAPAVFRTVPLPGTVRPVVSGAAEERIAFPARSRLPGGPLGTAALAGLALLGVLGTVAYRRGQRGELERAARRERTQPVRPAVRGGERVASSGQRPVVRRRPARAGTPRRAVRRR